MSAIRDFSMQLSLFFCTMYDFFILRKIPKVWENTSPLEVPIMYSWRKYIFLKKNKHFILLHKSSLDFEKQPKIIIISSVALKFAEVCFTLNKSELKKKYTYV